MIDYLPAVMAMLGQAQNRYADPSAWNRLHAELGIRLPNDYQTLVDAYAPIELNCHLSLHHPATGRWNLGDWIQDTARAWSEVPWDDLDADEDPRLLFGLTELSFGTSNGLWPIASTDRGETLFLTAADGALSGILVEDGEGGWAQYEMSFAEWLYRYLIGEDMAGPNTSAFYPGPVQLRRPPMAAGERPEPWSGPERGM
ncbi:MULTISPECIES: SMI1/KNR4 family protein [unclassified Streptomyces]|uniref:SMI1/KNR4 family protein n=1 Tax=unclassified Streptomyces TaxID=2593676 RepID=UPI001164797B|nr:MULTISPECIES: SMI1/KNR4 family protein [unclassified Streptomyces]QDN54534.1 SMI1/KNR4 family protein [Streptomyces sp. S1D4-20]QDN64716.1 SMI1/KNR4 family protein [Streptomyces sp. S1D4-14]QDO47123.1 SMI1/KNR4 family protein [Streptomyces sp. RLB3-5]QDO57364.1 SMI1/KNR4 family protein [Streptomyces sp. RLB1-8]